jgi:hypothetical protein
VDEEERQRIEGLFVSDPDTNEKILIAEADLIEDYLEDSLPTSERDMFLSQYGNTPQQRRDLRITRSIKEWAVSQPTPLETATPASGWATFLSGLRLRNPRGFIPVAAVLIISFIVSVWLLQLNGTRMQENTRRAEIDRELVDLNRPLSPGGARPPALSIVLPPVSVRSVEPQAALNPQPDTRVVELQLLWTQKERFQSYRAVLRRVGNPEQFIIPDLHLEREIGGSVVRLRLPAHLLSPGLYQVRLSGIGRKVPSEQAEEYTFMVGGSR